MRSSREVERISSFQKKKMGELSEREKRAMAAEKRLASQLPADSAIVRCAGTLTYTVFFLNQLRIRP